MNPTHQRIKELALEGLLHQEIASKLPHLRPETVRVYFSQVISGLTSEEADRRQQARARRTDAPSKRGYHRRFSERRTLGPEHIRIGRKLLDHRLKDGMTLGQFSDFYEFSNRVVLSSMEQGYHDFTMTEVQRIARILGTTIEDLLCPPPGALAA